MSNDPSRRHTYGFTIMNLDMRMWFCDRAEVVVSEPFNIVTVRRPPVYIYNPQSLNVSPRRVLP